MGEMSAEIRSVAVVGAGISGICASYLLSQKYEVSLFEKNDYLGGHTNTRLVTDRQGNVIPVDTGFIVCNLKNYPNFYRLLSKLGVTLRDSDMSFSVANGSLHYLGPSVRDFIRRPQNLLSAAFLRMMVEQRRFNAQLLRSLECGTLGNIAIDEYVAREGFSRFFVENYLTPLVASIWSSPEATSAHFPVATLGAFFKNHGMLELSKRPQWQTVVGGSQAYVAAFRKHFRGQVFSSMPVAQVFRRENGVELITSDGERRCFDYVVMASHADETLRMLEIPSTEEKEALQSWKYNRNKAVLHTDSKVMRGSRIEWAAWNYSKQEQNAAAGVSITYYMNRLQGLSGGEDYFVTLNPYHRLDGRKVLYETTYYHPVYTPHSVSSQAGIRALNGVNRTFYCGAHLGYGFHEDGVNSALEVATRLGNVTL